MCLVQTVQILFLRAGELGEVLLPRNTRREARTSMVDPLAPSRIVRVSAMVRASGLTGPARAHFGGGRTIRV
ncbi:UNVERIFIED_CONTAM: hypothetical protein LK11_45550 [Mumia flava]